LKKQVNRLDQAKIIVNSAKILPDSQNIHKEKIQISKIKENKNGSLPKSK
jgi:hypothetical protein